MKEIPIAGLWLRAGLVRSTPYPWLCFGAGTGSPNPNPRWYYQENDPCKIIQDYMNICLIEGMQKIHKTYKLYKT